VTTEEAHRRAREKGVSRPLYALVRMVLAPLMRVWFRMRVSGREHIPAEGAAILAPNHKSFYDSFFVGICTRRHLRFMGKVELFEGWKGPLLVRLGAFPVERGKTDTEALETARAVLAAGGLLAIFPEGTRVRTPDALGSPKRGAGRLALESGASLVPAAITGTENLFAGPFPKPRRVQVAFGAPLPVAEIASSPDEAGRLVEEELWPEVETQFGRLRARSGIAAAALAALGVGGGIALRRRRTGPRARLARSVAKAVPRRSRSLPERVGRAARRPRSLGQRRRRPRLKG
jgi:1-acyl-sn-glycerol-3-phosphate acyltransferase